MGIRKNFNPPGDCECRSQFNIQTETTITVGNVLTTGAIYPILMSLLIFAGSMEFIAPNFMLMAFNPLNALLLTLMVNARHLFYGISMLDKYRGAKKKVST